MKTLTLGLVILSGCIAHAVNLTNLTNPTTLALVDSAYSNSDSERCLELARQYRFTYNQKISFTVTNGPKNNVDLYPLWCHGNECTPAIGTNYYYWYGLPSTGTGEFQLKELCQALLQQDVSELQMNIKRSGLFGKKIGTFKIGIIELFEGKPFVITAPDGEFVVQLTPAK